MRHRARLAGLDRLEQRILSHAEKLTLVDTAIVRSSQTQRISNAFVTASMRRVGAHDDQRQPATEPHHPAKIDSNIDAHDGPLLSVTLKDNIATNYHYDHGGRSTLTCASRMLDGYRSPVTSGIWRQLNLRGEYALMGKTNMDEFGMGSFSLASHHGQVKIPNAGQSPKAAGGSSGGSAVAVATHACDVSIGTDTGGSVRLPAAYTGIVGFKPSYGAISRYGVVPYANSLDTVGVMGRNIHDVRETFELLEYPHLKDPTSISKESRKRMDEKVFLHHDTYRHHDTPLRIGVPMEYNIKELSPEIRQGWADVLRALEAESYEILPVSLPSTKLALPAYYLLAAAEAASNLAKYDGVRYGHRSPAGDAQEDGVLYAGTRSEGFGDEVKRRILLGNYTLSASARDNYFLQAQKVRRLVQADFDRVFSLPNPLRDNPIEVPDLDADFHASGVDVLICPTSPTTAPTLTRVHRMGLVEGYMNDVFTVPASLAGLPAISVPVTTVNAGGQPSVFGLQVIGQYWDDQQVLAVAERLMEDFYDAESPLYDPEQMFAEIGGAKPKLVKPDVFH